jgi:hypothetical protein
MMERKEKFVGIGIETMERHVVQVTDPIPYRPLPTAQPMADGAAVRALIETLRVDDSFSRERSSLFP